MSGENYGLSPDQVRAIVKQEIENNADSIRGIPGADGCTGAMGVPGATGSVDINLNDVPSGTVVTITTK